MGDVTAIVPLKALHVAKGRLAAELDGARRRELAGWMCGRVVSACAAAPPIDRIVVVAGDDDAAAAVAGLDVEILIERTPGLAAAMACADRHLAAAPATLVVAADVPLVAPEDLEAVCDAGRSSPAVVVAPTGDGGTGALLRRPPGVLRCAFGGDSARRHLALAAAAGVPAVRLLRPRLSLDVDTPNQLREAAAADARLRRWLP